MIASKLNIGNEIRVIAPSRSLSIVRQNVFDKALKYLSDKGFIISFSNTVVKLMKQTLQVYNPVLRTCMKPF